MNTRKDFRALETEFRDLIMRAAEGRLLREGRYSANDILNDVRSDEQFWQTIAEGFAQRAATAIIHRQLASRKAELPHSQQAFSFVKELPVPTITYKGAVVSTLRATPEEYAWYTGWYERRLNGTVKRSRFDKKTLARLKRFGRIVDKYRTNDPNVSLRAVLEARQTRLEKLRLQRAGKRKSPKD